MTTAYSRRPLPFPSHPEDNVVKLQALDTRNVNPLLRRRAEHLDHSFQSSGQLEATTVNDTQANSASTGMSLGGALCARCGSGFGKDEQIVNSNGEVWHHSCFVPANKSEAMLEPDEGHYSTITAPSGTATGNGLLSGATNIAGIAVSKACNQCKDLLDPSATEVVNYNGQLWHPQCFVCAQCFRPFPDGVFYEFEGRKFCEHDFNMLFAPCCAKCQVFIVGRVIKAMSSNWHPHCFTCASCSTCLADSGYFKNSGRALCKPCNERENAAGRGKYWCFKCHSVIEEGHLKFKGEAFHPYHFNCTDCGQELTMDAREKAGELYCLRCYDKSGIPICGACRRPIDGERIVYALGKAWHVEHFVCAQCEKPFLGTRHFEKKGLAYCELHYHHLFGNICFVCNDVIHGDVFSALNKSWCVSHFACAFCDKKMGVKSKFYEFDLKPTCKGCYDKFPSELRKRLKKAYDQASPKK